MDSLKIFGLMIIGVIIGVFHADFDTFKKTNQEIKQRYEVVYSNLEDFTVKHNIMIPVDIRKNIDAESSVITKYGRLHHFLMVEWLYKETSNDDLDKTKKQEELKMLLKSHFKYTNKPFDVRIRYNTIYLIQIMLLEDPLEQITVLKFLFSK